MGTRSARPKKRPWLLIGGGLFVVVALAVGGFFVWEQAQQAAEQARIAEAEAAEEQAAADALLAAEENAATEIAAATALLAVSLPPFLTDTAARDAVSASIASVEGATAPDDLVAATDELAAASDALVASVRSRAPEVLANASAESVAAYTASVEALSTGRDLATFASAWSAMLVSHEQVSRTLSAADVQPTVISGILVVNKTFRIPSSYGDGLTPETEAAFAAMQAEAATLGLDIYISSGFRSFGSQESIYNNYVATDGQAEADRYSARPGHSEHQTGLTFDLNSITEAFGSTPEGIWVRDNAHRFGFAIRYLPGKEAITGYVWEPWHLRYFGVDVATALYSSGLTLEEYLGVTSAY